jgi:uncharacterized Fe-S cluster protein YjdI
MLGAKIGIGEVNDMAIAGPMAQHRPRLTKGHAAVAVANSPTIAPDDGRCETAPRVIWTDWKGIGASRVISARLGITTHD